MESCVGAQSVRMRVGTGVVIYRLMLFLGDLVGNSVEPSPTPGDTVEHISERDLASAKSGNVPEGYFKITLASPSKSEQYGFVPQGSASSYQPASGSTP